MSERTCRCCGHRFEHPAPGALSTRRYCGECSQLSEGMLRILDAHQTEIARLKRLVEELRKGE
jgi:hypothetical protein